MGAVAATTHRLLAPKGQQNLQLIPHDANVVTVCKRILPSILELTKYFDVFPETERTPRRREGRRGGKE